MKPGDSFERYTIEALIGQGGMGRVYRAHDSRLERRVALKVISDHVAGQEASARMIREARAAAALDHPNAVAIFDVGERDGAPYIVMELVEGRSLRGLVGDAGVPLSRRVATLADAGRALSAAHRRGLVHRDVKPENVMIRDDGMVKVLDFGIARRAGGDVDPVGPTQAPALPTLTVDGEKLGTPVYMAPEQIRGGTLDGRADQFSWGVVAFELLAGRLPWRGADALAAMASALTDPVERAPLDEAGVPRAVQDVVLRALAKRPEERFASMEDAVRALEAAERGEAPPADPPPGATAAQRFSTEDVREVLSKAIERQASRQGSTEFGFDDLLAVAAEAGIDTESLREASRALRAHADASDKAPAKASLAESPAPTAGDDAARRNAWLRRVKRNFHRHAGVYVIVNVAILVLGVLLRATTPWWVWVLPALGWGIGLAIHGLVALTANEDDWTEHNQGLQWWTEERRRRHEERLATGGRGRDGADRRGRPDARRIEAARIAADSSDPARIDAGGELSPDKLRVASETGHDTDREAGRERAAEEEGAEIERGARRHRHR